MAALLDQATAESAVFAAEHGWTWQETVASLLDRFEELPNVQSILFGYAHLLDVKAGCVRYPTVAQIDALHHFAGQIGRAGRRNRLAHFKRRCDDTRTDEEIAAAIDQARQTLLGTGYEVPPQWMAFDSGKEASFESLESLSNEIARTAKDLSGLA